MLYTSRNILRLCRKNNIARYSQNLLANGSNNDLNGQKQQNHKDFKSLFQQHKDKIVFSSYLEQEKIQLGHYKYYLKHIKKAKVSRAKSFQDKKLPPLPVALQYYVDEDRLIKEDVEETKESEQVFHLPFSNTTQVEVDDKIADDPPVTPSEPELDVEFDKSNITSWMTNYEYFDDTKLVEEETLEAEWCNQYGTPDPSVGISNVPCGGCGALLHCNDPAIPGYLPSELFQDRNIEELKTMVCQRCHFLKEYNIALDVSVEPEEYEKLLQSIRKIKSLVLLIVDLLDFPCSIWPGIVDIIGTDRPLIIVANKVDLLPGDSEGYLKRIRQSLMTEINKTKLKDANIKYVALVSAKTGYGVEELISTMFRQWQYRGDVFLVGCTNVGKSSLFNALLQSDYCKAQAVDIVQRATVSRWPGTTLNLLKFPINRPCGWKIRERSRRLATERMLLKTERKIRKEHIQGRTAADPPSLMGYIGRTFTDLQVNENENIANKRLKLKVLDEKHEVFRKSKWLYDTPGVIHPDQVLSLLSTEELLLTLPKKLIRPQTYYLRQGSTIFIAGLARVDVVECGEACRLTIFCSENLPITVVKTEDAENVYDEFVGTELFAVPSGDETRLRNWPKLEKCKEDMEFTGEGPKLCCGDVVLSSIAWVSVTAKTKDTCKLAAWTPEGRGIHKRYPSLLPYSVNLKGKRVHDTPAYMLGKFYVGDED
ncbi:nitric oxide-associated protein 1 [Aricia agestis]|uniref:nitric oxide-associated protein 1 n=1 Tax=Aricia agestis TaxID=91739 RepID=UPI001C206CB6|nr:nitric oxide-associated protein 1 [Aricia agestis]